MLTKNALCRGLSAILAVLLSITWMTSCAFDQESSETTGSVETTAQTVTESTTVLSDDLPDDLDYHEDEIVIISISDEFNPSDLNGGVLNDSLYERNEAVESRLNIRFNCIQDSQAIDKVAIAVGSGDDGYDILVEASWRAIIKATENYYRDLRETDYLDFDKIWWNQSFNEAFEYNGSQYAVTGDMLLSPYRRTYATVFNKELFTAANQTYLYEYVSNGTWTLDKQASLVPIFHQDNGNQQSDMMDDIFGFVSTTHIYVDCYFAACEVDIISKNAEGVYEWVFDAEKMYDVTEKIFQLYYQDGSYIEQDNAVSEKTPHAVFSAGHSAMATLCLDLLETPEIRLMPQEYGVVPMPKFDETQTSYHSQMHDGFNIVCVPSTVSDERTHMLSAVLEAMASSSYRIVRPAYYETVLRTQIASDPQSAAMIDIVINNIHIDIAFAYTHQLNTFHHRLQEIAKTGRTEGVVSTFEKASKSSQRALGKLIEKLDKLSEQS